MRTRRSRSGEGSRISGDDRMETEDASPFVHVWCIDFTSSVRNRVPVGFGQPKWSIKDSVGDNGIVSIRYKDLVDMKNKCEAFKRFQTRVHCKMPRSSCCSRPTLGLTIRGHLITDVMTASLSSWEGSRHPLLSEKRAEWAMRLICGLRPGEIIIATFVHGPRCSASSGASRIRALSQSPAVDVLHELLTVHRPGRHQTPILSRRQRIAALQALQRRSSQSPMNATVISSSAATQSDARAEMVPLIVGDSEVSASASSASPSSGTDSSGPSSSSSSVISEGTVSSSLVSSTPVSETPATFVSGRPRVRRRPDHIESVGGRGSPPPRLRSRRRRLISVRHRDAAAGGEEPTGMSSSTQGAREQDAEEEDVDVEVILDPSDHPTSIRRTGASQRAVRVAWDEALRAIGSTIGPSIQASRSPPPSQPLVSNAAPLGSIASPSGLDTLVSMGFSSVDATRALSQTGGNIMRAIDGLLGRAE